MVGAFHRQKRVGGWEQRKWSRRQRSMNQDGGTSTKGRVRSFGMGMCVSGDGVRVRAVEADGAVIDKGLMKSTWGGRHCFGWLQVATWDRLSFDGDKLKQGKVKVETERNKKRRIR